MTMPLNLILLAAGGGTRFKNHGYDKPKPLIDVDGVPMFVRAIRSAMQSAEIISITVAVQTSHIELYSIDENIKRIFPDACIVRINGITRGSAETAMQVLNTKRFVGPIALLDCDLEFLIFEKFSELSDVTICTFESQLPCYSYAKIESEKVTKIAEKKVLSKDAIAGFYVFKNQSLFRDAYEHYLHNCVYNELYISGLIDLMIDDGFKIHRVKLEKYRSFGTPEELLEYTKNE